MTELRVHGVGGTPPDVILCDLAPEQVSGDAIAGFYRTSDHRADLEYAITKRDVDRHVEVYSWGGLTSRSKVRLLWLALLPFLFGNLAGWMCSARTRQSAWRFRLHRLAYGLGALALTVNAALVAVMISADVLAYQTARAGLGGHQWWLAPLGWHFIAGHPARQVTFGVLVVVLFVLALTWLASRTWRYEAVRPPRRVTTQPENRSRTVTAATLPDGLADEEFWDGESSVRLISWLHVGVVGGFLAIVLGITAKALTVSPHFIALAWIAIGLGGAVVATGVAYICLDAMTVNSLADSWLSDKLRGRLRFLPVPAAVALLLAGVFAWLQPGGPGRAAELPGIAGVIRWTALAIAVVVAVALISMLLGLSGSRETLKGGPWVTLMLGFATLNIVLLGTEIWVAHLVGPVTSNAADALSRPRGKIYVPYVITSGVPLLVWAAVLAVLAFGLTEGVRWLRHRSLPDSVARQYQDDAMAFRDALTGPRNAWYQSGLHPFAPPGDATGDPGQSKGWEQKIARAQFVGRAPHDATWLLWSVILAQLAMGVWVWQIHIQPPALIRNIGIAIVGLALPTLMAFLYSAWNDPTKRRTIGVLWDVGTFWPRSYHPLSPPCYTERAIPELQRRMWWLHDNGGRVVLVAHSQGAMLATAALVQSGCRPDDGDAALITFGSPVCKLYSWGFPAYVDRKLLEPLVPGGTSRLYDWRNYYYPTDPIGGAVAPDLPAAGGGAVDHEFLDPAECYYVYGQPPPASQGHSGYWTDPRVWDRINTVAAALQAPAPAAGEGDGGRRSGNGGDRRSGGGGDQGRGGGGRGGGGRGGRGRDGGGASLPDLMNDLLGYKRQSLDEVGPASARVAEVMAARQFGQSYVTAVFWWLFTQSDAYKDAARRLGASRRARPVVVSHANGARSDLLLLDPRRRKRLEAIRLGAETSARFASSALPRERLDLVLRRRGLVESLPPEIVLSCAREIAASPEFGVGIVNIPPEIPTAATPHSVAPPPAVSLKSGKGELVATLGSFFADVDAAADGTCMATTANHALGRRWRTFTVGGTELEVVRRHKPSDSCLVRVDGSILGDRSRRGLKGPLMEAPRAFSEAFFSGAASGFKPTTIHTHDPGIVDPQPDLLCRVYTNPDTAEGDSGAALIDKDDYIVGFAMGISGYNSPWKYSYWVWAQQVYMAHRLSADKTLGA